MCVLFLLITNIVFDYFYFRILCALHVAANTVFMYDAPPPYPGIDANLPPYPNPSGAQQSNGAAAAQAPVFTNGGYAPGSSAGRRGGEQGVVEVLLGNTAYDDYFQFMKSYDHYF